MLRKIQAPNIFPITLMQLKSHLRIEHPEEDDYLNFLIDGATEAIQSYIGQSLLIHVWQQTFSYAQRVSGRLSKLPILPIRIPLSFPPLLTIKSVVGTNSNKKSKTINNYTLFYKGDLPVIEVNDPCIKIEVTYETGYGDRPNMIPADIRQAILQLASVFYQKRCAIPIAEDPVVVSVLQPHRILSQV